MKYTKATARTLYLTGSCYEIGFRLGDVISKDTVWPVSYTHLPFSILAICFTETWLRSESSCCVSSLFFLASLIFCPKAVKSSIGIIVHLKYILSFRFAQRNNLIVLENRTDYADSFLITWLLHDYGVSGC